MPNTRRKPEEPLAKREVENAAPEAKVYFLWDRPGRAGRGVLGLGLRVQPTGTKSWVLQYRLHGRKRRVVIARFGELDLEGARGRAREWLAEVWRGPPPPELLDPTPFLLGAFAAIRMQSEADQMRRFLGLFDYASGRPAPEPEDD